MFKNINKKILIFFLLFGGLFLARFVLAQDFGTEIVNNGLNGSLGQVNTDPRETIARVINIALGFLSVIAVIIILYAGFLWTSSGGEEEKISRAKSILRNGVIGLIIILSSWGIATFLINKFSNSINGDSNSNGGYCRSGDYAPCGCGGSMYCSNGVYGGCIGETEANCSNPPTSCDSSSVPGCQKANQICASGYYCDNSCLCQTKGELGDSCDGDTNSSTCEADNNRCADYLTCNPDTCTCDGPPVITGLSPVGGFCESDANKPCLNDSDCGNKDVCNFKAANGAANNFITISGKNFGDYSATGSKVVFVGSSKETEASSPSTINPSCVSLWRNDQIVIAVPNGAQSGPIKVINKDKLEDTTSDSLGPILPDFISNNINRPGLCNIDPVKGSLNADVNYQGVNLYSGSAYFGNYQNNVNALYSNFKNPSGLSGTSTIPNIKEGGSGSFVQTVINGFPQKSNYLKFTKLAEDGAGPYIMDFSPSSGAPGQYITIRGVGFGGARGESKVYFVSGSNKIEASYIFPVICANSVWLDNQIIVKVPAAIANGPYEIEIKIGDNVLNTKNLNPNIFTVDSALTLKPSLCKMDPEKGAVDTPVNFWGEYFGLSGSNGLVRFSLNKNANGLIGKEKEADTINTSVPKGSVTGPVQIIKSDLGGNSLNFSVAECTKNDDCDNQICCPQNTYRKGRCVASLDQCFINIPTSVFEWSFSTSYNFDNKPVFSSCLGLSKYLGSCYQGAMCPNSPGACSSQSVSYDKVVGSCDLTCNNVSGCTSASCAYNAILDRCVDKTDLVCSSPEKVTFTQADYLSKTPEEFTTEKICNANGKWQISSTQSCPNNWERLPGNICVQTDSKCNICGEGLSCQKVGEINKCVSEKLCKDKDASCLDNLANPSQADNCVVKISPTCECCCRIGHNEDCCAPLTCAGKCGSDVTANTNTYGSCSGCAGVGKTQLEHDAACNCSSSNGKFCTINNDNPQGICTDCEGISDQATCGDHSSSCCWDSNKTATTTDDFCRGVGSSQVISIDKSSPDYGYCAYFACDKDNSSICASTTLVKVGPYSKQSDCIDGCPNGGKDICNDFKVKDSCLAESACCWDFKKNKCISGNQISSGLSRGYCAYYNCQKSPEGDPYSCDLNATTTGRFKNIDNCSDTCPDPPGGAGKSCLNLSNPDSCDANLCTGDGLSCLQDNAAPDSSTSCGACCCQPATKDTLDSCITESTPDLRCTADQGACSGASRGLCCGCKADADCGSEASTGCGSDTCCQARPKVSSVLPEASATNVCRNASVKITFDQKMNTESFVNNFVLFEERNYGNGVCPAGTYLADADVVKDIIKAQNKNVIVRLWENISVKFLALFKNDKVLAAAPSAGKLYCSVPGMVTAEENAVQTSLIFSPNKALNPSTRYFVVVKGDEILNSQTGVLNAVKIGMNEKGFRDALVSGFTNPAQFNGKTYTNAYSFQFTTLSDQGASAGICAIDHVVLKPESYLFKTTDNDLNEIDQTDSVADRDKVFVAGAYSLNNQLLHPVAGYYWDWKWLVADNSVAEIIPNSQETAGVSSKIIAAKAGIVDAQTKVSAAIDMDKYISNCGSSCNALNVGNKEIDLSDIYVFVCSNPWPAPKSDGSWAPWVDTSNNCVSGSNCESYNYKFYYCRDAGAPGTSDDLPAINNSPVSNSGSLLCSSNNVPCSTPNSSCDDGKGVCLWNVLKESYFFRESIPSGVQINSLNDTLVGGEAQISWQSNSTNVGSYKVYYLKGNKGEMLSKEFKAPSGECRLSGQNYLCSAKISGLVNGIEYVFKVSAISNNRAESLSSEERTIKTSDKTAPSAPVNFSLDSKNSLKFSWKTDSDLKIFYRLYHGTVSGKYAESFDSVSGANSLTLDKGDFNLGVHYFALTAIDESKNESAKSVEVTFTK